MSKNSKIITFVAGALAGAAIGILFAPDKGKRTRKKLKRQVRELNPDLFEKVENKATNVKDTIEDYVNDLREKLNDLDSRIKAKGGDSFNEVDENMDAQ